MTAAKAAHVASAKAADVASATTSVSAATATTTAGLCTSSDKAAGKQRSFAIGGTFRLVRRWRVRGRQRRRRDGVKMGVPIGLLD